MNKVIHLSTIYLRSIILKKNCSHWDQEIEKLFEDSQWMNFRSGSVNHSKTEVVLFCFLKFFWGNWLQTSGSIFIVLRSNQIYMTIKPMQHRLVRSFSDKPNGYRAFGSNVKNSRTVLRRHLNKLSKLYSVIVIEVPSHSNIPKNVCHSRCSFGNHGYRLQI